MDVKKPYIGALLRQTPSPLGETALQSMADAASAALAMMDVARSDAPFVWERHVGVEIAISDDQRVRIVEQYLIQSDTWRSRIDVAR